MLGLLVAVWIWRVGVPMWQTQPLPEIDYSQLNHPAIATVEPYPPTIYVTVDGETWGALDAQGRYDVIGHTRRLLEGEGFNGALFRTKDGATVGQWLKNTGIKTFTPKAGS